MTHTQILIEKNMIRYITGSTVYTEVFALDTLVPLYWSTDGQIWPEYHFNDEANLAKREACQVFQLGINGEKLNGWRLKGMYIEEDTAHLRTKGKQARVTLYHEELEISVDVCTRMDGSPFLTRWVEITNHSEKDYGITHFMPFAGRVWDMSIFVPMGVEAFCSMGVVPVYSVGYNHCTGWGEEGDFYFDPLDEIHFNGGLNGKSGFSRPAFWLRNNVNGQTLVCEYGYSGNWQMDLKGSLEAYAAIGMARLPEGEVQRVLCSGERIVSPQVYVGMFRGEHDKIVHATHDFFADQVMRAPVRGREIEIEANHRGYLCDRETVEGIKRDVDMAFEAGVETYVVDAGWYGTPPNFWWNNAGDWFSATWLEKGGGLKAIADYVHEKGMYFGLWMELEASGATTQLRIDHPDWSMTRYGEPVADGRQLDFTKEEVLNWIYEQVCNVIDTYEVDMFRIDNNHLMGMGGTRERKGYTENLTWRYYEVFYDLFARLNERYPRVTFQNCAGGGGRHDWGIMRYFNSFEFSDCMRPPTTTRVYNGLTMSMPACYGLKVFGTEVPGMTFQGDLLTQLRGAFLARPIIRGIAPYQNHINPALDAELKRYVQLYRALLRPILAERRMYHHTPFQPVKKPQDWTVVEHADRAGDRSVICAFATANPAEKGITVYPKGIRTDKLYRVTDDNTGEQYTLTGRELRQQGIPIASAIGGSVLLILERI